MCGRFTQYSPVDALAGHYAVDETLVDPADHRPSWNVAPTREAIVIATASDGTTRKLGTMRWGFVPHWAADVSIGNRMINARSDRVATSKAYRDAFTRRRCIVPVDGFYEWGPPDVEPSATGGRPRKIPFHIHRADRAPLALAGLWETWRDAEDRPLRSFTILTCDANTAMAPVHDRMPVILDDTDVDTWLARGPLDDDDRARLLVPAPDDLLVFDRVSTDVNRPVNDHPGLVEPVS